MGLQAQTEANDYLSGTPYICTIFRQSCEACQEVSENADIFWANAGKCPFEAIDPAGARSRLGDLLSMILSKNRFTLFGIMLERKPFIPGGL
jgi:hypothetical protein